MQPPAELEAVAQLLQEAGVNHVQVCPPGTDELPLAKNSHWRLSCRIGDGPFEKMDHFDLSIVTGDLTIQKVVVMMDGIPDNQGRQGRQMLGYTGHPRIMTNHMTVPLADPEFHKHAVQIMQEWFTEKHFPRELM